MKFLVALLLMSQTVFAATPSEWNACLQSFRDSKTIRLNVEYSGRAPNENLVFSNGWLSIEEGFNIFHKGEFWYIKLTGEAAESKSFDKDKIVRANLGGDSFCLQYNFNPWFSDKYTLMPLSSKCKKSSVLEFQQNHSHDSAGVLEKKLSKDIDRTHHCFLQYWSKTDMKCSAEQQQGDFDKIKNWNTAACKALNSKNVNKEIARHEQILREFPVRKSGAVPSPESPAGAVDRAK